MKIILIIALCIVLKCNIYAQNRNLDSLIVVDRYNKSLLSAIHRVHLQFYNHTTVMLLNISKIDQELSVKIRPIAMSYDQISNGRYYGYFNTPKSIVFPEMLILISNTSRRLCKELFIKSSKQHKFVVYNDKISIPILDDYYSLTFVYKDNQFILQE